MLVSITAMVCSFLVNRYKVMCLGSYLKKSIGKLALSTHIPARAYPYLRPRLRERLSTGAGIPHKKREYAVCDISPFPIYKLGVMLIAARFLLAREFPYSFTKETVFGDSVHHNGRKSLSLQRFQL